MIKAAVRLIIPILVGLLLAPEAAIFAQSGGRFVIISSGITELDSEVLKRGSEAASGFFSSQLGRTLRLDVKILAFPSRQAAIEGIAKHNGMSTDEVRSKIQVGLGSATTSSSRREHQVWMILDHPDRHADPNLVRDRRTVLNFSVVKILGHELFHLLQKEILDAYEGPLGPSWIAEGTAEFIGAKVAEVAGTALLTDFLREWQLNQFILLKGAPPEFERWNVFETFTPRVQAYNMSAWSFCYLAQRARDARAVVLLYEAQKRFGNWNQSFAQTFGQDPSSFFVEFRRYLERIRPHNISESDPARSITPLAHCGP